MTATHESFWTLLLSCRPSYDFKAVTYAVDGTRAVTGNMCVGWGSCPNESQYLTGNSYALPLEPPRRLGLGAVRP